MKENRLEHLDGIRGIAAFSVMMGHVHWPSALANLRFFTSTPLWVDFFFVLSGFVMARSYLERIAGGMSVAQFMGRRFARIYPLHLLTLLAALAYELFKWGIFSSSSIDAHNVPFAHNNTFSFACTALLIHALGVLPASYWNGPSWSISAEFYVYLAFALCIAVTRSRRALFWTLLIGLQVLSFGILATFAPDHGVETDYGFFRCVLGFGLGVIVEHFCRGRVVPQVSGKSWLNVVMAGVVITLVSITVEGTLIPLYAPFLFAIAVWMLVQFRGGIVERLLRSRLCQTLGVLSYSIYMTHAFFLGLLTNAWRVLSRPLLFHSGPGAALLNEGLVLAFIGIVLAASWFCYRHVELPAQRWLNLLFDRSKRVASASVTASPIITEVIA
jgi:peptidoglycan/LPS O-acetylase OafA/YrhL